MGCATTQINIVLPPMPQRQELNKVQTLSDMAEVINYYEHLVQEWEQWGREVEDLIN